MEGSFTFCICSSLKMKKQYERIKGSLKISNISLLSIASSINISSFTNQTYQRRKILKLNGKFTNLEAQLTLHLTCTGAIKMTSITPKNLTPKNRKFKQSKNPIQDQLNPPKYSRISALRQYIKVNPPL